MKRTKILFKKEVVSNLSDEDLRNSRGGNISLLQSCVADDRTQCISIVNHDYTCGCPYDGTLSTYPICTGPNTTNFLC